LKDENEICGKVRGEKFCHVSRSRGTGNQGGRRRDVRGGAMENKIKRPISLPDGEATQAQIKGQILGLGCTLYRVAE